MRVVLLFEWKVFGGEIASTYAVKITIVVRHSTAVIGLKTINANRNRFALKVKAANDNFNLKAANDNSFAAAMAA